MAGGIRYCGLTLCLALALAWPGAAPAQSEPVPAQPVPGEPAPSAPTSASARPTPIPTSAFAARSLFSSLPELAPDGNRIAYSIYRDGKSWLGVVDIETGKILRQIPLEEDQDLRWFTWAGNDRLLISLAVPTPNSFGAQGRAARLFVADLTTRQSYYVGPRRQGLYGDELIFTDPAGEFVLLAVQPQLGAEPQVWRFGLDGSDSKGEKLESRRGVLAWVADDAGVVRLGFGFSNGKLKVWYRRTVDEDFRVVARLKEGETDELWELVRLVSGKDEGLVLEPGESGHLALRRFNYATREVGETVYEVPGRDIEDFDLDDDGKPLAVHYTDDIERTVWLDPELARLQSRLERALGAEDVRIMQQSADRGRMLIWKGGASDPGSWYVYTASSRELEEFSSLRPELPQDGLAPVEAVDYPARDGTSIRAYLTLPPGREPTALPLIVLPHGGPYGLRDRLEYSDEVQLLANRGYAVLQPNYRGSGGYGDAFVELGDGQIGRSMQDDLDDAVAWAAARGLADPARVCLVGSSYGGYAALWGVIRNPEIYRCAASFAGVTDWDRQLAYDGRFLDRADRRSWRERIRGEDRRFELDLVSPVRQAARLDRPVLVVHGRKDSNVPFSQFELMRDAIAKAGVEQAEFLVLPDAGHGFATAADEQAWYDRLVAFLARHNPPD